MLTVPQNRKIAIDSHAIECIYTILKYCSLDSDDLELVLGYLGHRLTGCPSGGYERGDWQLLLSVLEAKMKKIATEYEQDFSRQWVEQQIAQVKEMAP